MVRWVRASVVAVALAGMISLSGVVLGRIFSGSLLLELVVGAAAGSVGLSLACRRLPNWVVAPLSAVLLAAYTLLALKIAAARADLAGPLLRIVRDSIENGIPRLLTALIPVEPAPETVVVPVIATWVAGLAGAEIAVRAGRVLLGLVPAIGLYGGALYVVGPNADSAGTTTVVFAALAVAALAASAHGTKTPSDEPATAKTKTRSLASTAAGLAAVLVLTVAVGPWISGQVGATPVDPRQYVEPPQVDSLDESPLNRISGWALTPKEPLLKVSKASASPGKRLRLRLAVLPDYDGVTWRVGATYRNAGRILPAPPRMPDAQVTEVRQTVTVDGLTGRLLPVVPTPTGVDGARVAFDASTGTMIRPEGLTPGLRYSVTSELQTPDLNLLPTADVPSGEAVARFLTVGGTEVPPQIQRLADQLAEDNGAAFDRAITIEEFLAEHYRKVADAPSGHAFPNLNFFLFGPRGQGGQVGTSEQFAASFALLARLTGLPSRVVVGFDAPAAGGIVTAARALAWPEVLFDGLGWVAFDPMPKTKDPRPVEEDFTPKPTKPPTPPSEPPPPTETPPSSAPPAVLAARQGGGPPAVVVAGGATGSVLLVLVAAAGTIVLMRRSLRRRRLSTGTPDDRITGAWAEFRDALRLAGQPVPPHLAATEAATYAGKPQPPRKRLRKAVPEPAAGDLPPLDDLVAAINTVGFAPGSADETQAAKAGSQAVAYADELRARRSWWRRLWWSISPGPLRGRR
ncbi:DUF3488 and transglutaminase-like domain-containing protein [Actinoplanes sp. Pm04-4]|uniref:DUF3488 and transglutaminase-like domain-containing protein n=1 Tax=Paractinoplanes pyxinae TaxID=2997416 RepID=A0ABT4BEY8_9ACTN|nr:DUF3488 and transglutaminase-like domain-containing protein [Actinoplanes pyxinae]MCY1144135.1 DUF3488 and transglutaminase-like domain-containing protein [Actinoplanes pyxinae]